MFIFPAKIHSRHPGEEAAGVGGVAEAAGCLALLGGGAVGGAEVSRLGSHTSPGGAGQENWALGSDRSNAYPGEDEREDVP